MYTVDRRFTHHLAGGYDPLYSRVFDRVEGFSEGRAAVQDGKLAYHICPNGHPAYDARFTEAHSFSEGLAPVRDPSGAYHVDHGGEAAYDDRHLWVGGFCGGLAPVHLRDGDYAFLGAGGRVLPGRYIHAGTFSEGLAPVIGKDGRLYYVDTSEREILGPFTQCGDFTDGVAVVSDRGGSFRIDREGKPVDDRRYDGIYSLGNGMWVAMRGGTVHTILEGEPMRRVGNLPRTPNPLIDSIPNWAYDLDEVPWDSCVVLMRHAQRDPISRSETIVGGDAPLTADGVAEAERIGRFLGERGHEIDNAVSSPIPRCVKTARAILRGDGIPCLEVRQEGLLVGESFISDESAFGEAIRPLMASTIASLMGKVSPGWVPVREGAQPILDFVRGLLDKGGLSLALTHDNIITLIAGLVAGCWDCDRWPRFCEGVIFVRRGDRYLMIMDGEEYPMEIPPDRRVDISLSDADGPEISGDWKVGNYGSGNVCTGDFWTIVGSDKRYSWIGPVSEGLRPVRFMKGRFGFLRYDLYCITCERFHVVLPFSNGTAPALANERGWYFINDRGEPAYCRTYLEARNYSEGYAAVRDESGWFHVDIDGCDMYPERYESVRDFRYGEALCESAAGYEVRRRDGSVVRLGGIEEGL